MSNQMVVVQRKLLSAKQAKITWSKPMESGNPAHFLVAVPAPIKML